MESHLVYVYKRENSFEKIYCQTLSNETDNDQDKRKTKVCAKVFKQFVILCVISSFYILKSNL